MFKMCLKVVCFLKWPFQKKKKDLLSYLQCIYLPNPKVTSILWFLKMHLFMRSTAESKRVFKNHKLHTKKWRWTSSYPLFLIDLAYIYIYTYIILLNTLSGGKKLLGSARSGSTAFSYQNCVITPGWQLMKAGYRTCFHTLYDEKKFTQPQSHQ